VAKAAFTSWRTAGSDKARATALASDSAADRSCALLADSLPHAADLNATGPAAALPVGAGGALGAIVSSEHAAISALTTSAPAHPMNRARLRAPARIAPTVDSS
jgi:hypothetical protein